MQRLPYVVERLVVALGLGLAFLLTASVFIPDWSQAGQEPVAPAEATDPSASMRIDPHEGMPSIGSIEDDCYIVRIYASDGAPLYSVYERETERTLGVLLTAEEVAEWFPELPVPDMDIGGVEVLMLADPDAGGLPDPGR